MPSKPHTDPAAWTPCSADDNALNRMDRSGDPCIVLCPMCHQATQIRFVWSGFLKRASIVCTFCSMFYPLSNRRAIPETKLAKKRRLAAQQQLPGVDGHYSTDPDTYNEPLF